MIPKYGMTSPCDSCPFRSDVVFYLRPGRVAEFLHADADFYCHKTTEVGGAEPGNERVCAGSMILREKVNKPNQMLRIAGRLGLYDPTKLNMEAPVYEDAAEMIEAFEELEGH